jgi:3-oxoacyl-[acyl-carrier protein] reductase
MNRVAMVTGASRGIGREIALRLAQSGHVVSCVASKAENCEQTVDLIHAAGGQAHAFGANLGDPLAIEKVLGEITSSVGDPLVLVNNAGITKDALMMRMKDDDWQQVIDVNLTSTFRLIRAAQRPMMKARFGRIVNISSVIGLHGGAGQVNYAASKAGLIGLTMSVAKELGSRGITCNAVAPGFIETDMTHELAPEMREHVVRSAPLGRLGTPSDIAPIVAFLCSEDASYITGQCVTVDGGLYL